MRILIVCRLFSGFVESVDNRVWKPTGAPAIYRLLDRLLTDGHEVRLLLCAKDDAAICQDGRDHDVEIDGLPAQVTVLAGPSAVRGWPARLRWHAFEWRQVAVARRVARRFDPDVVYVDRGNLWTAAYFARFTSRPVAYRIMGVIEGLTDAFAGNRPTHQMIRWCLRSPFGLVICSQDGSGGELWLDRMLRPGVPRHLLLNGVDLPEATNADSSGWLSKLGVPPDRTIVLFLGRLEAIKGCDEFLAAFLEANRRAGGGLHAVIVGTGSRLNALRSQVADADAADDVTFVPTLPHREVLTAYAASDIYVSLNRQGNLSNANLEAFRMGACCIVPEGDSATARDVALDKLFGPDVVMRVPSVDHAKELVDAILALHDNPRDRERRGHRTREIANAEIGTWHERMTLELGLLTALAQNRSNMSPVSAGPERTRNA